ncbi:MAG: hypothetical protein CL663_07080 [Bacteroidetes bacterium]|nr:hypothetical protein [Bacteroidota bacterium]
MKYLSLFSLFLSINIATFSQDLSGLKFGTESTFEVASWNIEHFPKNGQTTIDLVKNLIEAMEIDLFAIQEVKDTVAFHRMVDSLSSYNGYLTSSWFAGLAYIYNPSVIKVDSIYEIYTTSPYWSAFPRSPMVMDLKFMNERILVINNHFKCCGDGIFDRNDESDEETRRYNAAMLLKEYIDTYFPNQNVIVIGDLNDILTDHSSNNVFQEIIDDNSNYAFADMDIANGTNTEWSYPNWPSHIDHILITNELFDDLSNPNSEVQTIKIDEHIGGWSEYDSKVSDHRPVALKLQLNLITAIEDLDTSEKLFSNHPNPFSTETTFSIRTPQKDAKIEVFNSNAQKVYTKNLDAQQTSLRWNPGSMPNGIYYARLLVMNKVKATIKLILQR